MKELTATETIQNMLRDNMELSVSPPMFVNQADFLKSRRSQRAINADVAIGGRFWCWHDYTFISEILASDAGEASQALRWFKHLCVKCGKQKNVPHAPLLENLLG